MPLQGTFDVLPFADVLELLATRAATGRLHVRSRSTGANIYLNKGRLVSAEVGEQATTGPQDVRSRLSDVSFELLEAERGSFEFNPDLTGMGQPTIDLEVGEVLQAARKQVEEWRDIQTVVPSLDLHPSLCAELAAEEVTLSREQWRVLSALDGRRSVRAVSRLLDLSDYRVSRTTKSLIEAGVVELDAPARPAATAGRDVTVFVDDLAEWPSEPGGNGDANGRPDAGSPPTGPETSDPLVVEPIGTAAVAPPEAAAAGSSAGEVEDHPTVATKPPSPPPPASPVATTVPIRLPATPAPATPPAPSKPRRPGISGLWRRSPRLHPNS